MLRAYFSVTIWRQRASDPIGKALRWLERKSESDLNHLPAFLAAHPSPGETAAGRGGSPAPRGRIPRQARLPPSLAVGTFIQAGEGSVHSGTGPRRRRPLRALRLRPAPRGALGKGRRPQWRSPTDFDLPQPPTPYGTGGGAPRWGHLQPHTWRRLERTAIKSLRKTSECGPRGPRALGSPPLPPPCSPPGGARAEYLRQGCTGRASGAPKLRGASGRALGPALTWDSHTLETGAAVPPTVPSYGLVFAPDQLISATHRPTPCPSPRRRPGRMLGRDPPPRARGAVGKVCPELNSKPQQVVPGVRGAAAHNASGFPREKVHF